VKEFYVFIVIAVRLYTYIYHEL